MTFDRYNNQHIEAQDVQRIHLLKKLMPPCDVYVDVGCGCGDITDSLKLSCKKIGVDGCGVTLGKANAVFDRVVYADLNNDFLIDTSADVIWCGETIEHILNTGNFLENCYRILRSGGTLILSTPNLSSWINRIMLLVGLQPFLTEVSEKYHVGNPFRMKGLIPGGHIHVFTRRAMKEILKAVGFKRIRFYPCSILTRQPWRMIDQIVSFVFPSLSTDIFVKAEVDA